MEKVSQLMDGEIEGAEHALQIRRLEKDAHLMQTWDTYHLIRDTLRGEAGSHLGLAQRIHERLRAEPTVIAPHTRLVARVARYSLPMAAAVAGVAVVGWLGLTSLTGSTYLASRTDSASPAAKVVAAEGVDAAGPSAAPAPLVIPAAVPANGQMNEYLLAHQEFSPSAAMQGAASYMRTLSNRDADTAE